MTRQWFRDDKGKVWVIWAQAKGWAIIADGWLHCTTLVRLSPLHKFQLEL